MRAAADGLRPSLFRGTPSASAQGMASTDLEQRALRTLRERFGHAGFQGHQREAVLAVLAGRDVLLTMPTGSGKSIVYQLPAVLLDGLVLVVSPLIALMKDQVDSLRARGF